MAGTASGVAAFLVILKIQDCVFKVVFFFSCFYLTLIWAQLGAKLPLYAFKKASKAVSQHTPLDSELGIDFLDSLVLGEVNSKFTPKGNFFFFLTVIVLLSKIVVFGDDVSGRSVCREDSSAMMSLLAKPRFVFSS